MFNQIGTRQYCALVDQRLAQTLHETAFVRRNHNGKVVWRSLSHIADSGVS